MNAGDIATGEILDIVLLFILALGLYLLITRFFPKDSEKKFITKYLSCRWEEIPEDKRRRFLARANLITLTIHILLFSLIFWCFAVGAHMITRPRSIFTEIAVYFGWVPATLIMAALFFLYDFMSKLGSERGKSP